jgi:hypothetical protein
MLIPSKNITYDSFITSFSSTQDAFLVLTNSGNVQWQQFDLKPIQGTIDCHQYFLLAFKERIADWRNVHSNVYNYFQASLSVITPEYPEWS